MQKENISFENTKTEYEKFTEETNIIREKIEKELIKLNNLENKLLNEMKESFKKQHDNLIKLEKELKEDLIKNVSKTKEELQNFINESTEIIKCNEKIGQYIKYYEKNKEKSNPVIIKTLSYISEIEKNNQKLFYFINESMKNMNITFNENKNTLEYIYYYFNGIPSPINIQSFEQNYYMNISWKIDVNSKKLRDITQYKYNLEIKDNNKNIYNYEGNQTNIEIRGLINIKEYEFRVRTIYKESYGNWSEYKKIKLLNGYNNFYGNGEQKVNIEVFLVELNTNNSFQNNNLVNNNNNSGLFFNSSSLFNSNINQNKNFISWKKII